MSTPESYVKKYASKRFRQLKAYYYMAVPGGWGRQTLDYLVCLNGKFVGAEAKAPGKEPTRRQFRCMEEIKAAGGIAFWFDSPEIFEAQLQQYGLLPLDELTPNATTIAAMQELDEGDGVAHDELPDEE